MLTRSTADKTSPLPDKVGTLLQESRWLFLGAAALFLSLALWGYHPDDPGWSHATAGSLLHNPAGRFGAWVADLLRYLFGFSSWLWVLLLLMFVWRGYRHLNVTHETAGEQHAHRPLYLTLIGFVVLLPACSALESLRFHSITLPLPLAPGGMIGLEAGRVVVRFFGHTGGTLALLALPSMP